VGVGARVGDGVGEGVGVGVGLGLAQPTTSIPINAVTTTTIRADSKHFLATIASFVTI